MRLGCILLAAGCGRRFGGNKLAYCIGGEPMIAHACALHATLDYAVRVLVAKPDDALVHAYAARYGFTLAVNPRFEQGIGTSAAAGMDALTAAGAPLDGTLFAVCDQPYLSAETVNALIARFIDRPACIVAPTFDGRRGNPVIFPRALFDQLRSLNGDTGGAAVIRSNPHLLRLVPVPLGRELMDIDTRGAVDHLKK